MMAALAMLMLAAAGQGAATFEMRLEAPSIPASPHFEYAVVCRVRNSSREMSDWRDLNAANPVARAPANARCRALVRPRGSSRYLATHEAVWSPRAGRLPLQPEWLRTVEAPGTAHDVVWVGASSAPGPECEATPLRTRCLYVPAAEPGVLVADGARTVLFALSPQGEGGSTWRPAHWGRAIRVHTPVPATVDVAVHASVPAFRSASGRLREAIRSADAQVHRLGPRFFWIEGQGTSARLDITAPGAAAARIPLSEVIGPASFARDIALAAEETIAGEVRSAGALVQGAVVLLTRLIDDPTAGPTKEEDRPREFVGETTTDASGAFRFGGLAREQHELLVVHPARGRARLTVMAPGRPRVVITPRAVVRGRVMSDGMPVGGAVASVLPAFDALAEARNPIDLFSESVRTSLDGRFECLLPEDGRASVTITYDGAAVRMELGDTGQLPAVVDLGDIAIEAAIDVEVHVNLAPGCVLQAAGPIGEPGMSVARALPLAAGRWSLRARLPGRWLFEASCRGTDVPLMPAVALIERSSRSPLVLEVARARTRPR